MIVADLQGLDGRYHRVLVLGSCRVRNPISRLASDGGGKIIFGAPPLTHALAEARQTLGYFSHRTDVPTYCAKLVFEADVLPERSQLTAELVASADTIIVEVCDSTLITYRDLVFQANYFARNFVQKLGRPVLDWWRPVSKGEAASEAVIGKTVDNLRAAGKPVDDNLVDLLRHIRVTTETAALRHDTFGRLFADRSKLHILVSHFVVPGEGGAIMRARGELLAELKTAAHEFGAKFFDPTELIVEYGRQVALDADGVDIYEYNPDFNIVVGKKLAEMVDVGWRHRPETSGMRRRRLVANLMVRADSLDARMQQFATARLERLGPSESGLEDHYVGLLKQKALMQPKLAAAQGILECDRVFNHYAVLRAGLGELGFLLATTGANVDIFEPSKTRFDAIRDFVAETALEQKGVAAPISVTLGLLPPDAYFARDTNDTLVVATGLLDSSTDPRSLVTQLAKFRNILIEPRVFGAVRNKAEDKLAVLSWFRDAGFDVQREVHNAGYWQLTRSVGEAGSPNGNRFLERLKANFTLGDAPYAKVVANDREISLSWSEFGRQASIYQSSYKSAEVASGGVVLIFLRNGPALYGAFFGAMASGLVPSFMPPTSPRQDPKLYWRSHKELLAHIKPAALVADSATLDEMRDVGLDFGGIKVIDATAVEIGYAGRPVPPLDIRMRPGSAIALLQHSSGTTGLKKGVALSFDAISAQLDSYASSIAAGRDDVIVSWLPLYHDMGLIACCVMPTYLAIPIVQLDAFDWLAKPEGLFEQIVANKGTLCWLPNFAFEHLAAIAGRHAAKFDLSGVRAFIDCSEACKPTSFDRFLKAFSGAGVRAEQLQCCYAMAESVFAVSQTPLVAPVQRLLVDKRSLERGCIVALATGGDSVEILSVGQTIDGIAANVFDENRKQLPEGSVGEIGLSGRFMFDGYNRDPDRTAAQVTNGTYFTRDLGFVYRSNLYVLGRIDDLMIINGRNLYAHEIEAVVAGVDGLKAGRGVALPWRDERLGSEVLIVIAERRTGTQRADADLQRDIANAILSVFNVSPRRVSIVDEGWLIKTTSGKISRKENLAKLMAAPVDIKGA